MGSLKYCAVFVYQSMGLIGAAEQYRKAETVEHAIQHDNRVEEQETGKKEEEWRESPGVGEIRNICGIIARGSNLSR